MSSCTRLHFSQSISLVNIYAPNYDDPQFFHNIFFNLAPPVKLLLERLQSSAWSYPRQIINQADNSNTSSKSIENRSPILWPLRRRQNHYTQEFGMGKNGSYCTCVWNTSTNTRNNYFNESTDENSMTILLDLLMTKFCQKKKYPWFLKHLDQGCPHFLGLRALFKFLLLSNPRQIVKNWSLHSPLAKAHTIPLCGNHYRKRNTVAPKNASESTYKFFEFWGKIQANIWLEICRKFPDMIRQFMCVRCAESISRIKK